MVVVFPIMITRVIPSALLIFVVEVQITKQMAACFATDEDTEQYKGFIALQMGGTMDDTWYPDTARYYNLFYKSFCYGW
jgi:hypothetical protein